MPTSGRVREAAKKTTNFIGRQEEKLKRERKQQNPALPEQDRSQRATLGPAFILRPTANGMQREPVNHSNLSADKSYLLRATDIDESMRVFDEFPPQNRDAHET